MKINFEKKIFSFNLLSSVRNSRKKINFKKGWIIKLKNKNNIYGYGEVSPLDKNLITLCKMQLNQIPENIYQKELNKLIENFHPCVQSGINSAMAEMNNILQFDRSYDFQDVHQTAILINPNNILKEFRELNKKNKFKNNPITIKWKVGIKDNLYEEKILEEILNEVSENIKIRFDANGSWSRRIAIRWADILRDNNNLDWLEQPLDYDDIEGSIALNEKVPVALDESLIKHPNLINTWNGWQIRRPSQERNPIKLFQELNNKVGYRSISTSFETGIGFRMLYHFSLLQQKGPTPKVPGLALKQIPNNKLFSSNPDLIWEFL